jgi:hypothetical protein
MKAYLLEEKVRQAEYGGGCQWIKGPFAERALVL